MYITKTKKEITLSLSLSLISKHEWSVNLESKTYLQYLCVILKKKKF